jgi:hypothetical protein
MDKVIYEKQNNKNILHLKRVRMTWLATQPQL